ncbi:TerD family protein [Streptomyces sp. NPDC000983]|uniref:TerD family protein n=1 Tax=Streptomyces sp. NPDC000983 TaxID=3154373 RepID=UPI003317F4A0
MTKIIKGGNLPAPGQVWKVAVVRGASGGGVPEVEAAVLLLDATGRVRGDGDVVFRDRRAHPSGAVRLIGRVQGEERRVADWLEIDTARVEPGVERIVITASSDEGTFGQVPGLLVQAIGAGAGERLALYEIEDATTEKAFVLAEFYRRDGAWRFRAVGQGYASGLAGLAEEYGIVGGAPGVVPGPGPVQIEGVAKVPVSGATVESPVARTPEPNAPTPGLAAPALEPPAPESEPPAPAPKAPRLTKTQPSLRAKGEPSLAAALFGEDFAEFVLEGYGSMEFTVDEPLPTGFFVVDTERSGDGSFMVEAVDETKPGLDLLAHTRLKDFKGRTLVRHNGASPLRLRVSPPDRAWKLTFRPVSAVGELGRGAEGSGRAVLLHTGPAGELTARLRPEGELPYFELESFTPRARGVWDGDALVSQPHNGREYRVPLPKGPVLVRVAEAEGQWSLKFRPTS